MTPQTNLAKILAEAEQDYERSWRAPRNAANGNVERYQTEVSPKNVTPLEPEQGTAFNPAAPDQPYASSFATTSQRRTNLSCPPAAKRDPS